MVISSVEQMASYEVARMAAKWVYISSALLGRLTAERTVAVRAI